MGRLIGTGWKGGATFALATLLWAAPAAHADIKLTAETTIENGAEGTDKTTCTIYLKGQKARRENADGTATLIDLDAKKIYTLDPKAKTYYERPLKEDDNSAIEGLPSFLKAKTSLKLKPESKTDTMATNGTDAATGATLTLTPHIVSGKMTIRPDFSGGGPGGGGFPGGGGPPGGGFPGGGGGFPGGGGPPGGGRPGGPEGKMPETKISGTIYTADAAAFGIDSKTRELLTIFVAPMLPERAPFAAALTKEFAKKLTVPLRSRLTVEMPGAPGDADHDGSTPDENAPPPTRKITVIVHTTELETKAALDDALFTLPTDYIKTTPPAPSRPPRGVPGGGFPSP